MSSGGFHRAEVSEDDRTLLVGIAREFVQSAEEGLARLRQTPRGLARIVRTMAATLDAQSRAGAR